MEEKYTIEVVSFQMNALCVNVDHPWEGESQIHCHFKTNMYEPQSTQDPTVMIQAIAEIKNEDNSLNVSCTSDIVFQFDPIPSDWKAAVLANCKHMIQTEVTDHIASILQSMGHPFHFE